MGKAAIIFISAIVAAYVILFIRIFIIDGRKPPSQPRGSFQHRKPRRSKNTLNTVGEIDIQKNLHTAFPTNIPPAKQNKYVKRSSEVSDSAPRLSQEAPRFPTAPESFSSRESLLIPPVNIENSVSSQAEQPPIPPPTPSYSEEASFFPPSAYNIPAYNTTFPLARRIE